MNSILSYCTGLSRCILLLSVGLLAVGLTGCGGDSDTGRVRCPDFNYNKTGIIAPDEPVTTMLPVDIYLDATFSMRGFAQPRTTNFSRLLEGIEAAVQNVAKSSDIRFFKYGKSVARLERKEFVDARNNPALWDDLDFRSETNFDQAVDSTDSKRVSIFITDLFYNAGDANKVVNAIQNKCFRNGVEMGLMGLKSAFEGKVGDVQPPVPVKGDRPLYLVVFGTKRNIQTIFSGLQNQPYVEGGQALLLTRYPVKSYSVHAGKKKDSKAINISSARKRQIGDLDNVYAFNWNADKGAEAAVEYTVSFEPEPFTLPISTSSLKAHVFRRDHATGKDSVADEQSLRISASTVGNGKISGLAQASLKIPDSDRKAFAAYQIHWQYDNLGRVELPHWITENSTQDFGIGRNETKTLKLDDLVRNLAVNAATQFEPRYGKMYLVFIRN